MVKLLLSLNFVSFIIFVFSWPWIKRNILVVISEWKHLTILGGFGMGLCGGPVYLAGEHTSATNIGLIYASSPLLILLISYFFLNEKISLIQFLGFFMGIFGVLIILVRGDLAFFLLIQFNQGDLWICSATLSFALYSLGLRYFETKIPNIVRIGFMSAAGVLWHLPFSIMAIFSMTFGVWLITDREPPIRLIKEPLVIAVLLGTLFLLNGWKLPVFFTNTLQLVGQTSIPLMLLTLGVTIAKLQITAISKLLLPSILKFIVCLLCGVSGIYIFELDDLAAAALLLQVTMPVAVSSYMLAEKYSSEAQEVAAFVVVSTLFALIYIPLTLAFLLH